MIFSIMMNFLMSESTLDMVDHDGDGLDDLRLLIAWGARGGQETYVIWYFDQETETFQFYGVQSHGEMVDVW